MSMIAAEELDALRKDAERYRGIRAKKMQRLGCTEEEADARALSSNETEDALRAENFALAANQCQAPIHNDYGHVSCGAVVWRTIETAPKDGTHILVGTFPSPRGHITIAVAHWFDSGALAKQEDKWALGAEWALSVNYDGEHSNFGVEAPTHWMPLPKAP